MRRFYCFTLVLLLVFSFLLITIDSAQAAALAAPAIKSAAVSGTSIVVKWGAVSSALQYEVYRSLNGAGSVSLGKVSGTSYTEKNVKPGNKHSYKVRALDAQGLASSFSAVKSVTVPVPAPVLSGVTVKGGQINVTWKAVSGVAKYEVYRSLNGAAAVSLGQVTGTGFTEKSIKPGAKYSYKVRAFGAQGTAGKFSSVKSVTVPVPAPVLSGVKEKGGQVSVTWKAVKGAAKYEVYRSLDGSSFTRLASPAGVSYTDKKVILGNTYTYKVLAVAFGTKSAFSTANTVKVAIPAPNLHSFRIFNSKAMLGWSEVPGAEAYQVFRSVDGAGYKLQRRTTYTSFTQENLTPGVRYSYRVRAVAGDNASANSNARSAFALGKPMPVDLYVTRNEAKMFWDPVPNAEQYTIFILNADSTKFEESISIWQPDPLTRLNTGYDNLPYGKSTSFYIEARAKGTASRSDILTVFPLAAPVVKSVDINGEMMEITWAVSDRNPPDTVYRLRETGMNNYLWHEVILKPEGGSLQVSYSKKIGIGEMRKFKIRAEYEGFQSDLATRLFHMVGTPTGISVQQQDDDIAVRWSAAEGARYYWVTLYDDDTGAILSNTLTKADQVESSIFVGAYLGKNIRARVSAVGEYVCGTRAMAEPVYLMREPSFKTRVVDEKTGRVMLLWSHVPGSAYHRIECDGQELSSSGIKQFFGSYWFDDGIRKPGSYVYTIRALNPERGYQEFTIRVKVPEPAASD